MRLSVENLAIARGGRVLREGLSFAVAGGEALALTGPNGAGKTTLLRTIAGFLVPEAGAARLEAADPAGDGNSAPLAERSHFIGHLNGVKAALTVAENARFWSRYLGGPPAAIETAIERVGLGDLAAIPAGYLSAGQKRRLAIARLLVAPRPLWLLDEPTAALDASGQAMLCRLADAHLAEGGIIVAATHVALGFTGIRELALGADVGEAAMP